MAANLTTYGPSGGIAFQVKLSTQNDIPIASTLCEFTNEIFDIGGNFNTTTKTFTAPVSGYYQINVHIMFQNGDSAATYYQVHLETSNKEYYHTWSPAQLNGDPSYWALNTHHVVDLDANDYALVKFQQATGTAQTDLNTSTSFFSGALIA